MPKVYNKRFGNVPVDAVYVGRPSVFGNPFVIGPDGDRDEVIQKFMIYLTEHQDLQFRAQEELYGKDLVCWCAPEPCHADVLVSFANR